MYIVVVAICNMCTDQIGVPTMATVDLGYEPAGKENNPKNNTDEQSNEGTGIERTFLEEPARKRVGHR